ncbi:MAG: isoprenyl transferase [Candidatus Marinimicrobia bacterium]|nr:isoprenyl transferase [Candidatus Neomarinimicrobiota bacterium]
MSEKEELEKLRKEVLERGDLPRHIAIIMDGNGRWAKERGLPRIAGHNEGINSVREVTRECGQIGIEVLTLYTFSVENWARPKSEVNALMNLLLRTIQNEIGELMENNVKLVTIGHLEDLPEKPKQGLLEAIEKTSNNTGLILNLAISYGGRLEIIDAVKQIAKMVKDGRLEPEDINDNIFSQYLYTRDLPDPDLLIRTSGESRVSNFLLWQIAYTELYITPVYWPAFRRKELLTAILDFQKRERRFGKISEQLRP